MTFQSYVLIIQCIENPMSTSSRFHFSIESLLTTKQFQFIHEWILESSGLDAHFDELLMLISFYRRSKSNCILQNCKEQTQQFALSLDHSIFLPLYCFWQKINCLDLLWIVYLSNGCMKRNEAISKHCLKRSLDNVRRFHWSTAINILVSNKIHVIHFD